MRRMNTLHIRSEQTQDHGAFASPALVTTARASLVHTSMPSLPQGLATAWAGAPCGAGLAIARRSKILGR